MTPLSVQMVKLLQSQREQLVEALNRAVSQQLSLLEKYEGHIYQAMEDREFRIALDDETVAQARIEEIDRALAEYGK